eukprot:gnl/TRDRNA2_/TRDRNA2_148758_c0_seq1.p1 gnl/TRDRNA2_/TRDRNA2_148758_c0~~gnl/TRDRNA2_/TRDRNA2_148758_c0_seq1.p1  ORF type:complete len:109 (-),score=17.18 gnl/TRDRNA2_/TRDRNA2_148758_c0_seq1:2-328(-)
MNGCSRNIVVLVSVAVWLLWTTAHNGVQHRVFLEELMRKPLKPSKSRKPKASKKPPAKQKPKLVLPDPHTWRPGKTNLDSLHITKVLEDLCAHPTVCTTFHTYTPLVK